MKLVCPECKNEVDFSSYPNLARGHVIECNICGITLMVSSMDSDHIQAEVIEEGK